MNGWWLPRDEEKTGGVRTGPRLGDLGPQVGGGAAEVGGFKPQYEPQYVLQFLRI